METPRSIQETLAPQSICFGCGPANPKGLRLRSFESSDASGPCLIADWTPMPHHEAFKGILNGGIIGALLDCHSNWAAAYFLMKRDGQTEAPSTVTADFHVTLKRPTPSQQSVQVLARPIQMEGSRVLVEATLSSGGRVTATCRGTFVSVPPGHPAYHRWV